MISAARKQALFDRLQELLRQQGGSSPLQQAMGDLVNTIHSGLKGYDLEQAVNSRRVALGEVLQDLGMSAKDAQDLTKALAAQEQHGQGGGGPKPGRGL